MMFHRTGGYMIVNSRQEQSQLGGDWSEKPFPPDNDPSPTAGEALEAAPPPSEPQPEQEPEPEPEVEAEPEEPEPEPEIPRPAAAAQRKPKSGRKVRK